MISRKSAWGLAAFVLLVAVGVPAQTAPAGQKTQRALTPAPETVRASVREYRRQHEADIVRDYARLLSLPMGSRSLLGY